MLFVYLTLELNSFLYWKLRTFQAGGISVLWALFAVVFVGSGIFKSSNPPAVAKAVVKATTHYQDPAILVEVSKGLGAAMPGLDIKTIPQQELLATRGW